MRILLVNDFKEMVGGTEKYLYTLAEELKQAGHAVEYYFGTDNYERSMNNRDKLSGLLRRLINLKHIFQMQKKIIEFKPDVIHVQNMFNELSPFILLGVGKIPVVVTVHDYQIVQAVSNPTARNDRSCHREICAGCTNCVGLKGAIYERIKRFIHTPLIKRINTLIAPSDWCATVLRKGGVQNKTIQMYNGFRDLFAKTKRERKQMVFIGRLDAEKGVSVLLSAISLVDDYSPSTDLIIIGDGPAREDLEDYVKQHKTKRKIRIVGKMSNQRANQELYKAVFLVVPSTWPENLPTVCIEALQAKVPIIASNIGGIPEIVIDGFNGLLFRSNDAQALSIAMKRLLVDSELREKLSQNSAEVLQKFSINSHISQLNKLYTSVVSVT